MTESPISKLLFSYLLICWYIATCYLLDEFHVRVIQHNMEVFHCVYRFEGLPILKPDNLYSTHYQSEPNMRLNIRRASYVMGGNSLAKCLIHKSIDFFSHPRCQVICCRVIF